MKNYHTHWDKLEYSFNYEHFNINKFNISNFRFQHAKNCKDDFGKDYNFQYNLEYQFAPGNYQTIAYVNLDLIRHRNYSYFAYTNKFLHNPLFQTIHNTIMESHQFPSIQFKKGELAIDTTDPIIYKFFKEYKLKNIKLDRNFGCDYYGNLDKRFEAMLQNNGILKSMLLETYYIKASKDSLTSQSTIRNRSKYIRLHNKTDEINEHSQKHYITKYLSKYIDTSKDVNRMELCFAADNLYNSRTKKITQFDHTRMTDSDYLTSIFNHYSMFNHCKIINTYRNIPVFEPVQVDRIVIPKQKSVTQTLIRKNALLHVNILKEHVFKLMLENTTNPTSNNKSDMEYYKEQYERELWFYEYPLTDLAILELVRIDKLFDCAVPSLNTLAAHRNIK